MIELEGEYTTAKIMLDDVENNTIEQIQDMINHESITNEVVIMPDTHVGSGSVIGFTMPISNKVVPNVIGVDIGCGMYAVNLGNTLPLDHEVRDEKIRNNIPFGFDVHHRNDYHMENDFPWEQVSETLANFEAEQDFTPSDFDGFDGYGPEYFNNLCERIEYNKGRAINSMGTLGGGNHFIEIGKSVTTGDYWCVIHSGSRGIGATIAEYWQEEASRLRDGRAKQIRDELSEYPASYYKFDLEDVSDEDLLNWVQGGKGEDWKNMDAIVEEYKEEEPEKIEAIQGELVEISKIASEQSQGNPLDYLEGEEAYGYIVDMIFAQRYASESRKKMAREVADILDVEIKDSIESTHNFIDFRDGIIRKGATRAYEGERAIVPFNMRDGTLLIEGKSNPEWNFSVCHGAGRVMSRRQAHEELDVDTFKNTMNDVFSTSVNSETLDEAPRAYKDASVIEDAIEPTARIIDRLEVVHNLKAE